MPFTPDYVCQNLSCKSYGRRHPNCRCAPEVYANGGVIHHCSQDQMHSASCEYFADGGEIASNKEFASNPDLAVDHSVVQHGLLHTLSRTGYSKSPEAMRAHSEFLDNHRYGRKTLQSHTESLLEPKPTQYRHDKNATNLLQTKLNELQTNPDLALNIGGDLGNTLPMHHAALAAKAATAMTYLQSIKPTPIQSGPLDMAIAPSRSSERIYHRQVAIAEDPKLILQYLKEGTLVPTDMQTLGSLYPKLRQSMQDQAFQLVANAELSANKLTHRQKRKLGILLGQPVTFQQTPQAIQAIMHANAPMQTSQSAAGKKPKKATDTELRQINKVNELSETRLQKLEAGK